MFFSIRKKKLFPGNFGKDCCGNKLLCDECEFLICCTQKAECEKCEGITALAKSIQRSHLQFFNNKDILLLSLK